METKNYKLIKNYFLIKTNWDNTANLLYKNAEGSQRSKDLWFKIKNRRIFDEMPDLRLLLKKINKEFASDFFEECTYNDSWDDGLCNCKGVWHMDGPVISLDNGVMSPHRDVGNGAYLQILGNSFWKLDTTDIIVLNPGDILFLHNRVMHEVWGEGPRMGLLMFALKPTNNLSEI